MEDEEGGPRYPGWTWMRRASGFLDLESKRGNRKKQTRVELFEGYFRKEEGKREKCLSAALGSAPKALRLGFPSAHTESR